MVDRVAVAEREARALALRRDGATYADIGQVLGVSRQMATRIVQRGLRRMVVENAEQARLVELDRLDQLTREALAVLRRRHYAVQGGEVVKRLDPETGREEELLDDGPVLATIACLPRVAARRAALLGLDSPTRIDASVSLRTAWDRADHDQRMELLDVALHQTQAELREREDREATDAEIKRLRQELAARGPVSPPDVEMLGAEQAEEVLGEAVLAGLAAAGVPIDQLDVDRLGDAIEAYLARRRGDGS
jgi:hypothetical protein